MIAIRGMLEMKIWLNIFSRSQFFYVNKPEGHCVATWSAETGPTLSFPEIQIVTTDQSPLTSCQSLNT